MGSPDNWIEDVVFENVSVALERKSKWDIEGYDKRPCPGTMEDGIIQTKISGIYADYVKNVRFSHVTVERSPEMLPYFNEERTFLHVQEIEER